MRGWLFHSSMPAAGLGQNTPPLAFKSLASSSTTNSFLAVAAVISDLGQPVAVLGIAPVDDVEERVLDLLGDGAARSGADLQPVEFADGSHFRGGAGEERLVGDVDLVARDALLHDLDPQVLADTEHGVAGDAVQRAGRQVGRVDDAALDHEDVLARALTDEARAVQEQRLVVAV